MKRALKRMKIQQFLKRNKTGQMLYDRSLGALDAAMAGQGLYSGKGIYTGMGEYIPDSNSLISKSSMNVVPDFGGTDDDSIIIRRREYVAEIYGPDYIGASTTTVHPFTIQSFPINPGLESTFPWLSQIAQNYDEYEMLQCIFTFKSTTTESSNSDNGQVGTIIMCTNYNSAAPEFRDKATMQRYMGAISNRLTETTLHGVECDPTKLSGTVGEYVRTNPVVTNQDIKTYDHGKFQIAIANASAVYANISLGELWVSYTVKLRKSKFFTSLGFGITRDIFVSKGNESATNYFGNNMLRGQQNNLGAQVVAQNQTIVVTFPAPYQGYLRLILSIEGSGFGISTYGVAFTGNCEVVGDFYGTNNYPGSSNDDQPGCLAWATQSASAVFILDMRVSIATNGVDNTLTLTPGVGTLSVINQTYMDISEYNASFSGINQGVNNSYAPIWVDKNGIVTLPY